MQTAFVTGSTGLLGNNLVRLLAGRGVRVKALARSREKAAKQFSGLQVEIIEGDMLDVARFAPALAGCDALFHTAAHFRDSYKGGRHWDRLHAINVEGTGRLLEAAHVAGIRRAVHTSSAAVLNGPAGQLIDETMERREADGDDYYRSKILADRAVRAFLDGHPDMFVAMVLPGWMSGPGDVGPTSAGQLVMDFARRKLPGRIPGSFSVTDHVTTTPRASASWAACSGLRRKRSPTPWPGIGRTATCPPVRSPLGATRDWARRCHGVPCPADRHRDLAAGHPRAHQHKGSRA